MQTEHLLANIDAMGGFVVHDSTKSYDESYILTRGLQEEDSPLFPPTQSWQPVWRSACLR